MDRQQRDPFLSLTLLQTFYFCCRLRFWTSSVVLFFPLLSLSFAPLVFIVYFERCLWQHSHTFIYTLPAPWVDCHYTDPLCLGYCRLEWRVKWQRDIDREIYICTYSVRSTDTRREEEHLFHAFDTLVNNEPLLINQKLCSKQFSHSLATKLYISLTHKIKWGMWLECMQKT